ncbi:hypothetical protein [Sphingomonas edaphi]|uniref:MobA/MobL protein domain-containing protein n=1 Tax=Sphingomonas edaphi TaxID=2315689 RepID=A0A418Q1Z9_9SPHN|nr:hypothetical protein [Sphingomonas edaphi]RIX31843.1 hypothetical protein D3M59_02270 [Sphingomonas edaphi]
MSRARKKKLLAEAAAPEFLRALRTFYHGRPGDLFTSARFYWPAGSGLRQSIATHFLAKRRPAGADSLVDTAAKVEVLLPADVPEDYTDPDFLVASYMARLPVEETSAFAQLTMSFPDATNLHGPWEAARSWLRDYYVERLGVPVVAILHAPFLAESASPVHLHALVLLRKATAFGWLSTRRDLAGDSGLEAAAASWQAWPMR